MQQLTTDTSQKTVTIVQSAADKSMYKFFITFLMPFVGFLKSGQPMMSCLTLVLSVNLNRETSVVVECMPFGGLKTPFECTKVSQTNPP